MMLKQELTAVQRQEQTLSPRMLQSLSILRMSMQELKEMVLNELTENPLLMLDEAKEGDEVQDFGVVSLSEGEADLPEPEREDLWIELAFQKAERFRGDRGDALSMPDFANRGQNFTEMLEEQINTAKLDPCFATLCCFVIQSLNSRGYFEEDIAEIAAVIGCCEDELLQALYYVQSLHPAGVGARSLEECLLLQLAQTADFDQYTVRLIKDGLDLLAKNDLKSIMALLALGSEKASRACWVVKHLTPIPSSGYDTGDTGMIVIPDALIRREGGTFRIIMNDSVIPRLTIHDDYAAMLASDADPDTAVYVKKKIRSAETLQTAVKYRGDTLSRVIEAVILRQRAFFEDGKTLVPMTMNEVAEELDCNVSTVSRAVQDKYISCAAGTIPLKELFSIGIPDHRGGLVSVAVIKERMRNLVRSENAEHPLSDQKLSEVLTALGMRISRRTVAKYRDELGIPPARMRKDQP